jgi:hypothetical protein
MLSMNFYDCAKLSLYLAEAARNARCVDSDRGTRCRSSLRKNLILIFSRSKGVPWQPSCSDILQGPSMLAHDLVE